MLHRINFIPVFLVLVASLAWWSRQGEMGSITPVAVGAMEVSFENAVEKPRLPASTGTDLKRTQARRELLEWLDRAVAAENYYHSIHGYYSRSFAKLGLKIPASLAGAYEILVMEAGREDLAIGATSSTDQIVINGLYEIRSNFPLPDPDPDYLRARAYSHLGELKKTPKGQVPDEVGVFRGYFRYDVSYDASGRKNVTASGIRWPVNGLRVEFEPSDLARRPTAVGLSQVHEPSGDVSENPLVIESIGPSENSGSFDKQ